MRGYNERIHWCVFNVIVRLFGVMMTLVGTGSISWGIYFFIHPEEAKRWAATGRADSAAALDMFGGVVTMHFAIGMFAGVIAFAVLRVRPYRPDLGDTISSNTVTPRNWWTGEPKM